MFLVLTMAAVVGAEHAYPNTYNVDESLTFRWRLDPERIYIALDEPAGVGWIGFGMC